MLFILLIQLVNGAQLLNITFLFVLFAAAPSAAVLLTVIFPLASQERIQALFEIGNRFWEHQNWHPNFARSTKDIILLLFSSSSIDLNNETQI